jgi:hypothetical protein
LQERREQLHSAIRQGNIEEMKIILTPEAGKGNLLAVAKNGYGRCCLHIAVLCQDEEMTRFIATNFRETLRVGDNVSAKLLYQYKPKDKPCQGHTTKGMVKQF